MTAGPLKSLTIAHLRGSVVSFSVPFEKDKKVTIIYGENGTGKSTICDAFDFLGNGNVGSLDDRGLGRTTKYWPSVGKAPSDVSVTLDTASGSCCAALAAGGVAAIPENAIPRVEVLRRSQILSLIQAKPAERYAAIDRFIDVKTIEDAEGVLSQLIIDLKQRRELAAERIGENREAIRQAWETAGKPARGVIAWAESETAKDIGPLAAEVQALAALQSAYARLSGTPAALIQCAAALSAAMATLAESRRVAEDAAARASRGASEVVGVLRAAQAYLLKDPSPDVCPLCESSDRATDLATRIDQRLSAFAEIERAQKQVESDERAVAAATANDARVREGMAAHAAAFEQARSAHPWSSGMSLPATPAPAASDQLAGWLTATEPLSEKWKEVEARCRLHADQIANLAKALATLRTNTEAEAELGRLIPRLESALTVVRDERRRFTDGVLSKIAAEVGRLYEAVHPGEGLNKIELQLDPKKRASLEIGASFGGQSAAPQAYFSDSHLDTLGLCIFLSLAALDGVPEKILVLDDILASADEPHVDRAIEMIYTESAKFRHCVVTTHYRPWREKFRWGWLKNGQCQFLHLTKWTATEGISLTGSIPEAERLRSMLGDVPPDLQAICAKAGVILEASLDFLARLYECTVPYRTDAGYSLGELLQAIDKKLRPVLRVEVHDGLSPTGEVQYRDVRLGPMLDGLTQIAQTRNVMGCHFNAISFELIDADALAFGRHVLDLVDALVDSEYGWPRSDRSGSYWASASERRRLHPLKRPT